MSKFLQYWHPVPGVPGHRANTVLQIPLLQVPLRVVVVICQLAALALFATTVTASDISTDFNHSVHTWSLQKAHSTPLPSLVNSDLSSPGIAIGLQRAQFKHALKLIDTNGENQNLGYLLRTLVDYPLLPYLHYRQVRKQLSTSPDVQPLERIAAFRDQFQDEYLARILTRHLQSQLLDNQDWRLYLQVSQLPEAANQDCAGARARFETDQSVDWTPALVDVWTKGSQMPELCRDVLNALGAEKLPGIKALWERIYSAIKDGRHADAKEMAVLLTQNDKARVLQWLEAIANPSALLQSDSLHEDDLLNRRILLDLLRRWSREDPPEAVAYWLEVRHDYGFSTDTLYDTDREMALRGAWLRLPQAYEWLHTFDVREDDLEVMEWRVRSALFAGDWKLMLDSLLALPAGELAEDHWSYWHARALEQLGESQEAQDVYSRVARLPTYYGFLSADKLGQPYQIKDVAINVDATQLRELRSHPDLVRAREYLHTGVLWEGRRIWNEVLGDLNAEQKATAARLAIEWDLPDRAIASANAAKRKDALTYRFPFAFDETIEHAAARYDLEHEFILAIARRESAYMADIKSPAGAVGLMQLMPATASDVMRRQTNDDRWDLKGRNISLTNVSMNIDMGSYYLASVGRRFNGHLALMAASYNAGPHRTQIWLPEQGSVEADRWIDTIPFSETRRYVRAVMAYMTIFQWRREQLQRQQSGEPAAALASVDRVSRDQQSGDHKNPMRRMSDYLAPVSSSADSTLQSADNS